MPKVGDTVWLFDQNRRVYRKEGGGPIWREHWYPVEITGETKRSWVVGGWREIKIDKKSPRQKVAFSQEDIDRFEFIDIHRYNIASAVERTVDYETLKLIAELVGYKP